VRTPIYAFSAASDAEREQCLRSGMDKFLAKPIQPTEFRESVLVVRAAASA
jgi:CheY-like chemotaxis protein